MKISKTYQQKVGLNVMIIAPNLCYIFSFQKQNTNLFFTCRNRNYTQFRISLNLIFFHLISFLYNSFANYLKRSICIACDTKIFYFSKYKYQLVFFVKYCKAIRNPHRIACNTNHDNTMHDNCNQTNFFVYKF